MIGGLHCYQEGFFADSVNVLLENGEWDLFIIVLFSVLYFGNRLLTLITWFRSPVTLNPKVRWNGQRSAAATRRNLRLKSRAIEMAVLGVQLKTTPYKT